MTHDALPPAVVRVAHERTRWSSPRKLLLALIALLVAALLVTGSVLFRAATLLDHAAVGRHDPAGAAIRTRDVLVPSPHGSLRARIYRPERRGTHRGAVLLHGVQREGMDEPRVVALARELARAGDVVLTPQLDGLARYRLDSSCEADIAAATAYFAASPDVRAGGVGLVGPSLAGGLALAAASQPALRGRVAFVVSMGGHHDLATVLRYLARGDAPDPYGLRVFYYAWADRLVPASQLAPFRGALERLLAFDPVGASRAAASLAGTARSLFDQLAAGDRVALAGPLLAALPSLQTELAALSPAGRLASLPRSVPVFLVHGASDRVIPPSEADANARELGAAHEVRLLRTPLLDHVTLQSRSSLLDRLRAIAMLARVLAI